MIQSALEQFRFSIAVAALLMVMLVSPGGAQVIRHDAVSPGGRSADGTYAIYDVVGQSVIGTTSIPTLVHNAGYIPVIRSYIFDSSTAVHFASVTAEVTTNGVRLQWSIAMARDLIGFNVYRSQSPEGPFANLVGGLIPASEGTEYDDAEVLPGTTYYYRVGAVDADGEFISRAVSVSTPVWRSRLHQNRPNPFNPTTTITFDLARAAHVTLVVYDALGRRVRTLVDDYRSGGSHAVTWDGADDRGVGVSTGVYYCRFSAGNETYTQKMTLLK